MKSIWTLDDLKKINTKGVNFVGVDLSENDKSNKKSKYGNKRVTNSGIVFDSEKESKRYTELKLMENAGLITALNMQTVFVLPGKTKYKADFTYFNFEKKQFIVEDVKSVATRKLTPFRMKKRMMKDIYNIDILET